MRESERVGEEEVCEENKYGGQSNRKTIFSNALG